MVLDIKLTLIKLCDNNKQTEAVIGFNEPDYRVDESDGEVVLAVKLLSGVLSSDVVVILETEDGSAQGYKCIQCFIYIFLVNGVQKPFSI